ncbi:molybdopterin synthase sulfur carrier subunit [Cocleimonas flava]|uniref:Molybdopterin synthase sulfur carrier subunit n=1 Tax=Cocleimonas flava TaxID=634765 RepID=A0A4R1ESE6_9GAMM|nr:molybdopterin converting factor subunit 1 [Cocleimonas flava]TCJ82832.1 molybdopterin synthase subunit MoaD [Cocleimonas flava]
MSIKVLYFASLREEIGRGGDVVDISTDQSSHSLSVEQLWVNSTGQTHFPDNLLVAVNQEYTNPQALLNDGDEVAFFPPVTGG